MIFPFTARKRSSKRRILPMTGLTPDPWRSHPSTCISTITRPVDSVCNSIFVLAIGESSKTLAFTRLFHGRSRVVNVSDDFTALQRPRRRDSRKRLDQMRNIKSKRPNEFQAPLLISERRVEVLMRHCPVLKTWGPVALKGQPNPARVFKVE